MEDGDQLRQSGKEELLRKAREKYEFARVSFKTIGDVRGEIAALLNAGDLSGLLGEHKKALDYYRGGLQRAVRIADHRERIRALNGIGVVYARLGDNPQALLFYRQAFELSQKIGDKQGEARSLTNLGEAHYDLSNMNTALDHLSRSVKLWEALGDTAGQAESLRYLGYLYTDLSEPSEALGYHQRALTLLRTIRDLRGEAQITNAIGLVYYLLGEREKAIECYSGAERIFRNTGDRRGLITALNGRGAVYAAIGSERALECHSEALQLSTEVGDLQGQIVALRYLGKVYRSLGDASQSVADEQTARRYYDQAIERHREALKLSRVLNDRRVEAYTLQDLGGLHDSLGERAEALRLYGQALILSGRTSDRRGQAASLNGLGSICAAVGQTERAAAYFRRALTLTRSAKDRARESLALFHLARLERDGRNLAEARRLIEAAIQIMETLRTKVTSQDYRAAYFASARNYYETYIDVLMRLHENNPQAGFATAAFQASELARARSLLELMREANLDIREGVDPSLLERERKLEETLNAKAERRARLVTSNYSAEAQAIRKEIVQLTTEYDEVKAQIKSRSPRYAAITQPQPLSLKEIQQQVLDGDSVLLEYMLGDERSYLWVVTRDEMTSYELPPRAQIEEAARKFRELLTVYQPVADETFEQRQTRIAEANARLTEKTASLSKLIIGPVIDKLAKKRLIIVPDGALHYIPFQALTIPATTGAAGADEQVPLLVDHEIVYEPSGSALALVLTDSAQRKPAPKSIAVFANPVFEADDPRVKPESRVGTLKADSSQKLEVKQAFRDIGLGGGNIPALPASREEAEAIMSVAPWGTGLKAMDFEANRATIMKPELAQYRFVHFATHGFVDYQHPELSGLVLSLVDERGQTQNGFLRLHDIYNLKLSANLVVLSACNTGMGKEVRGEGLIGLTRGFMYAGASGVAASLWKVDDDATAELMKGFYEGMFRKGLTPAAAMRESQLALRRQKRWHAPYYWAAFTIQGQYDQIEEIASPKVSRSEWLVASAGVLSSLFLASCLVLGRRRSRNL